MISYTRYDMSSKWQSLHYYVDIWFNFMMFLSLLFKHQIILYFTLINIYWWTGTSKKVYSFCFISHQQTISLSDKKEWIWLMTHQKVQWLNFSITKLIFLRKCCISKLHFIFGNLEICCLWETKQCCESNYLYCALGVT